ncbi:MAG: TIGR03087 family PEP-CTERM/XrtA system glycosyltransferase [Candidatus Babeliaceae bacterium]|nr:TIGR03087 family PEP-CTERM/XrtA system glycosyltransferase [Candidatus Babeliaceae bacterium]
MNILFLAHRVPYPPNKGDKIRSFHEIKFLSQRHEIDLVCLADNNEEAKSHRELAPYCRSAHVAVLPKYRANLQAILGLFSHRPLTLSFFFSRKLRAKVTHLLQQHQYDLIFTYSSSMTQYVEHIQHIPKVVDFVDVDSDKWTQYALHAKFPYNYVYRSESIRLRNFERAIAQTYQHCFLVSPKEVADFRNLVFPQAMLSSIQNGIDPDTFQPSLEPYDPDMLVFTGTMDYWANVQTMLYFAREILPLIQRSIPNVKLYIVGSNPSKEVRRLAEQHANISITGYVDQVQPYVVKSAVFVAPMQIGRGINNKILEAMAMGVPVITSSLGFEGKIIATPGEDLFVEDRPDCFAKQVINLLTDSTLRKRVSINARKVILENYDWDKNLEKLEQILLEVKLTKGRAET